MKKAFLRILTAGFISFGSVAASSTVLISTASTETSTQEVISVFPGTKSQWEGCDRYDFKFQDRDAIVIVPKKAAPGRPWIWRPAFFGAFPSVDQALLKEGFHIVYYDLTHLYGSPHGVKLGNDFYAEW